MTAEEGAMRARSVSSKGGAIEGALLHNMFPSGSHQWPLKMPGKGRELRVLKMIPKTERGAMTIREKILMLEMLWIGIVTQTLEIMKKSTIARMMKVIKP